MAFWWPPMDENFANWSASSIGGHQKFINNSNRLYGQGSTPKCLHKQAIITAQISFNTRKIKQTNGGEKAMIHKYQVYTFPRESISRHSWPSLYWHVGSQRELSMITQIIEGQVWYFSSWIQYTLGKVQGWWGPRHIISRGFRGCHRIATTSRKGMVIQKVIQCSRLTATQNRWIGKIDEKYCTRKNS